MRRWLLLPLLFFAACGDGLGIPDQSAVVYDLAIARDMAMPMDDLKNPHADAAVVDQAAPLADLGAGDDGPCSGGYLNSDAGDACPLNCAGVTAVVDEGRIHIPFCTEYAYVHDPPACGPHWPYPAIWGVHSEVLPREWWVHNLEHGGIVLLYNCPTNGAGAEPICDDYDLGFPTTRTSDKGCLSEITQMTLMYTQHPLDQYNEVRMVVTSDPLLPTRFGAVAWDWAWGSDVFDAAAVQCLIDARYGRGPEDIP